ncbi:thiol oxidoreductase [Sneathiella sp. P13V-1]|uniref:di-heme oxidoreductase family protein n=1 Tax=Sneathiella sp. P13V-1 TaxID=2697366 RepID=UPI00187B7F35|nr:di-heme oxidoredictase family protein [Sneathiella sp. P13V-1]MBE7635977.1 thiol oxidoreductase [Sneathiella sp. P13V-1]
MKNFIRCVGGASFLALSLFCVSATASENTVRTDLSEKDRARVEAVIRSAEQFSKPEAFENMSGGAGTHKGTPDRNAFSEHSANLSFEGQEKFKLGNGLFRKLWVSSPSSTQASDGLGPLFNARSCQRCHLKDGRGHPPTSPEDTAISMFLRLSVPPRNSEERQAIESGEKALIPEPTYGGQFQDFAIQGVPAEGRMTISYEEQSVTLEGGEVVSLRKPTYGVADLGYGPMSKDVMFSPRVAPQMIGLGLLEAIHPADISHLADPDDKDKDGISGKISWVGAKSDPNRVIGRFGWKASTPTVRQQSAGAFAGDIGISSPDAPRHYGDCTENQKACLEARTGVQKRLGDTEAPDPVMDLVSFYSSNLAVPARRNVGDPEVLKGKEIFHSIGCASCHTPKFVTRRDAAQKEHAFQLIWPYSDLLLHDMGPGLSDNRPVGEAAGSEWRTAPLWGIGLTETVSGHTFFLHDGRARNLKEAILWHGGEGKAAKEAFVALPKANREALISFLNSL